jgi:hypothetical protein
VAPPAPAPEPSLADVLGGRGGAVDASVPVAAFVASWLLAGVLDLPGPVAWGGGAAVLAAAVLGVVRLRAGTPPRAVVFGLFGVAVAAVIALSTGRAADFFLVRIASNAVSALAWAVSIVVRWPLLGLVAGGLLGQRTRWRCDPDLVRGYQRASWVWVAQYVVRLAVFLPLYFADAVVALGVAQTVLTWPLVALCVALSWPLVRSALPAGHGGILHPARPGERHHSGMIVGNDPEDPFAGQGEDPPPGT